MQSSKALDLPKEWRQKNPSIHDGTIAAGEKLIADGSLKRWYRIDQEVRAGAMEDSGFAQAAEANHVAWCIFRGISDYGDPTKGKEWQFACALAAAAAGITFLRELWDV
jgi:nucleoside phosphorylase